LQTDNFFVKFVQNVLFTEAPVSLIGSYFSFTLLQKVFV